jgi:hypothetical protein
VAEYPCIVDKATVPPGRCAVTGDIDGPFIDTGKDIVDPGNPNLIFRIYLHVPYVEQMARLSGMVQGEDQIELEEQLESLSVAFDALTHERSEA